MLIIVSRSGYIIGELHQTNMVNKKRLIKLTRDLIRIDSQNPPGNEYRIACFVKRYLARLKLKTRIYEFKKRRPNVVAVLAGKNKKYSLLITPHLDTVPAGNNWHFNPFKGALRKGKIYGLGATDCKGNLACGLEAINSLVEERALLDYNLIFAATSDEESGSDLGIIALLEKGILNPDAAVVLDSDDFAIIVTQKGLIHLRVKIQGLRAHGAYPWRGVNAIDMAVDILKDVRGYKFPYVKNISRPSFNTLGEFKEGRGKYLRPPSVNVGTIRGGDKVNIVADWCEFELDFRFLHGMSEKQILKDLRSIISRHTRKFTIEVEGVQKPYKIHESHSLVRYFAGAISKFARTPRVSGSEGATTITFFQKRNIPAIATGFGSQGCAHTADEYAKIDNLYKGALVLEDFLKNYKFELKV